MQDGFVPNPTALTQTKDGYIWVGSSLGLFRFDGIKFTQWMPPDGQSLPSKIPYKLLGSRDGTLWIGTAYGLSRIRDGQLHNYVTVPRGPGVSSITEDDDGSIWITRYFTSRDGLGPLCRVEGDGLKCFGKDDGFATTYGLNLTKDAAGNFWMGSDRLTRWTAGSATTFFEENLEHRSAEGIHATIALPDGSLLVGFDAAGPKLGIQHLSNGTSKSFSLPGFNGSEIRATRMLVDRKGSLWIGTESEGIYRIYQGAVEHFSASDGLTGNAVDAIYEDVEGNLWVTTDKGIDVFRDTPVLTFSTSEGLIGINVSSVLGLKDGSIWVGNSKALNLIDSGRKVTAIEEGKGLAGHSVTSMFEDSTGITWVGVDDELMVRERNRFTKVADSDGKPLTHSGIVASITEDAEGNVWALTEKGDDTHLIRIRDRRVQQKVLVNDFLKGAWIMAADRESGIWLQASDGKTVRYRNGNAESISIGSPEGGIRSRHMFVDTDNSVWTTTTQGLIRWKDGAVSRLDSSNGVGDCLPFYYSIKDDGGSLWVYANCGLLKVPATELAKWSIDPQTQVSERIFGPLEGAFPSYSESTAGPKVAKSADGRLWFTGLQFIQVIDPNREHINPILPPVHIEGLVADRTKYIPTNGLSLPPLTRDLEIDYTALSFSVPQHVNFRYKLDGHDPQWQEVGTRRQAYYGDLSPGDYQFQVIASNNDGLWNETGATLTFKIEPAWYQTVWFRVALFLAVVLIGWMMYRLRVRQIANVLSARFDERLAERTRVAREIHDTFLQTVQGSKLVADHALKDQTDHPRMVRALEQLSTWLGRATEEGRAALQSLRSSTTEKNDLAEAFRRAIEDCRRQTTAEISFTINGQSREMHPIVRDEIYRIGYEAIRNACAHAKGDHVDITLEYAHDVTFRVRDNGIGLDSQVAESGAEGHFGLRGMKERADRIGAKFSLDSSVGSGTVVTLIVPGRIVFQTHGRSFSERLSSLFQK